MIAAVYARTATADGGARAVSQRAARLSGAARRGHSRVLDLPGQILRSQDLLDAGRLVGVWGLGRLSRGAILHKGPPSTGQNLPDAEKSVTRQVEHATVYAARKGWTVDATHIYQDDRISGAEFVKRPGFLPLMDGWSGLRGWTRLVGSSTTTPGRPLTGASWPA